MNFNETKSRIFLFQPKEDENIDLINAFQSDYDFLSFAHPNDILTGSEPPPDLILYEIQIDDSDFMSNIVELSTAKGYENIPLIVVCEASETALLEECFRFGASDSITKPFYFPTVMTRLRSYIELSRCRRLVENLSLTDVLTGLPNKRRLEDMIEIEWRRSLRSNQNLSMILMNVDHFKAHNDACGHRVGDRCLTQIAHELSSCLRRASDFIARYDGDEFAALLPDTDAEGTALVAAKMRKSVQDLEIIHGCAPLWEKVTLSLGTTTVVPKREISPDVLLKKASQALFEAKDRGRDQVVSDSDLS